MLSNTHQVKDGRRVQIRCKAIPGSLNFGIDFLGCILVEWFPEKSILLKEFDFILRNICKVRISNFTGYGVCQINESNFEFVTWQVHHHRTSQNLVSQDTAP